MPVDDSRSSLTTRFLLDNTEDSRSLIDCTAAKGAIKFSTCHVRPGNGLNERGTPSTALILLFGAYLGESKIEIRRQGRVEWVAKRGEAPLRRETGS